MQTKAIDTVREWDPAKAEAYLKVNTNPWTNGILDIKTIELICIGLNANCTNLQPEPTRRHIRAALQAGATRNEIQLVIEGAAFMAIHACSLGAPILLEEGKAAGKTPTVKNVATPSADMMKAKGLWTTAWDPFFGLDPRLARGATAARHCRRWRSHGIPWPREGNDAGKAVPSGLSYAGAGHHAAEAGPGSPRVEDDDRDRADADA